MKPAPRTGLFISIDGIDGSGKTTLAKNISARLYADIADLIPSMQAVGWKMKEDHEIRGYHPLYGTKEGRAIFDEMLARPKELGTKGEFELLTIRDLCTAHEINVRQNIEPHLNAGEIVLADRYIGTIYAYNVRSEEGINLFNRRTEAMTMMPHLAIVVYVEPEVALSRIGNRAANNSIDALPIDYFKEVSNRFYELSILDRANGGLEGFHHTLIGLEKPDASAEEIYQLTLSKIRNFITQEITKD